MAEKKEDSSKSQSFARKRKQNKKEDSTDKQNLSNEIIILLNQKQNVLEEMITEYESIGTIRKPAELEIKKPFKNVNFNLMEKLHEEFVKACNKAGKSQRKVIHELMKGFVDQVNSEK